MLKIGIAILSLEVLRRSELSLSCESYEGCWRSFEVDRKFRTCGSNEQKLEYYKRPPIEAVNSFLKTQYSMASNKVRDLKQVVFYALCSILCLALNKEAAQNIGKHEKAESSTYFNT
jgi:hypothetical protein